jgi:hypothetical protein
MTLTQQRAVGANGRRRWCPRTAVGIPTNEWGWPRIHARNRPHADGESGLAPRADEDRDEYPPAVGRRRPNGTQKGLVRGINPIGWMADVMYVRSSENRSHGSSLGAKLRRFCNGTRFRYVFG